CAGALVVGARIRLVRVLEWHEVARLTLGKLEREAHGAVRALLAGRLDDRRAVQLQEPSSLLRRVGGQDAGEPIPLELCDERERDARVAGRRLEELAPRLELAYSLGGSDHREGDAILDRARRVLALELRVQPHRRLRCEARQLDQRGVADELEKG